MIAIFIGAAVAALFFLIAAVLLGGWGYVTGMLACLLVMMAVEKYDEHKKAVALRKWEAMATGYNAKVWGV